MELAEPAKMLSDHDEQKKMLFLDLWLSRNITRPLSCSRMETWRGSRQRNCRKCSSRAEVSRRRRIGLGQHDRLVTPRASLTSFISRPRIMPWFGRRSAGIRHGSRQQGWISSPDCGCHQSHPRCDHSSKSQWMKEPNLSTSKFSPTQPQRYCRRYWYSDKHVLPVLQNGITLKPLRGKRYCTMSAFNK